jgi:septal ring factor EnvC (AmiA/AmiB activator)
MKTMVKIYTPKMNKQMTKKQLENELKKCDQRMVELRKEISQVEDNADNKYKTVRAIEGAWNAVDRKIFKQHDNYVKVLRYIDKNF